MQEKKENIQYFSDVLLADESILKNLDQTIVKQYESTIFKLIHSRYKSADLKQIKPNRFSARINDTHRLLFTTVLENGTSYLLLLEIILNHNYQKSKYLEDSIFKNYMITRHEGIKAYLQATEKHDQISEEPLELPTNIKINYSPRIFYNRVFIALNDIQQSALQKSLPLIISGAPGSGKSCLGFSLLNNCYQLLFQIDSDSEDKILYITSSRLLVNKMQEMWDELADKSCLNKKSIAFKTFEDFYKDLSKNPKERVSEYFFKTWIHSYIKINKTINKTIENSIPMSTDFFSETAEIYQEFRIIAAYYKQVVDEKENNYYLLGKQQSIFTNTNERIWLYTAYKSYIAHLKSMHKIDLGICDLRQKIKADKLYQFMVIDEAQDLSHLQLRTLYELVPDHQICLCIDSNQTLCDKKSKLPFILELFRDLPYSHINLPWSYRCPPLIADFANQALKLKHQLTGGLSDKYALPQISLLEHNKDNSGRVCWLNPADDISTLIQEAQSVDLAVITLEEYREEAGQLYKTPLVFTPKEIKGLEYKTIIIHQFLSPEICNKANKKLQQLLKEIDCDSIKLFRAKSSEYFDEFLLHFNQFFTSITRATESVYMYQTITHNNHALVRFLKMTVNPQPMNQAIFEAKSSSREEWIKEAEKLQDNNQECQVIAKTILEEKTDPQDKINIGIPKQRSKPFTANTISPEQQVKRVMQDLPNLKSNIVSILKYNDPGKYLFHTRYNNESLFSYMVNKSLNHELGYLFSILCKENHFAQKISMIDFCTTAIITQEDDKDILAIELFIAHPTGLIALISCIKNNKNCMQNVSPLQMYDLIISLASYTDGKQVLEEIFIHNPIIKEKFFPILFNSDNENYELFFELCSSNLGVKLLEYIFNTLPIFTEKITVEILTKPHNIVNEIQYLTAFFLLSKDKTGQKILQKIFKNSARAKEINGSQLCYNYISLYEKPTSVLISPDPEVDSSVKINNRPAKKTKTTPSIQAIEIEKTTIFFWLIALDEKMQLFNILLELNPNLIQEITIEALTQINTIPNSYSCSAFLLMANSFGERITFLNKLIKENRTIRENMLVDNLFNYHNKAFSITDKLMMNSSKVSVLTSILNEKPKTQHLKRLLLNSLLRHPLFSDYKKSITSNWYHKKSVIQNYIYLINSLFCSDTLSNTVMDNLVFITMNCLHSLNNLTAIIENTKIIGPFFNTTSETNFKSSISKHDTAIQFIQEFIELSFDTVTDLELMHKGLTNILITYKDRLSENCLYISLKCYSEAWMGNFQDKESWFKITFIEIIQKYICHYPDCIDFLNSIENKNYEQAMRRACFVGEKTLLLLLIDYVKVAEIPLNLASTTSNGQTAFDLARKLPLNDKENRCLQILNDYLTHLQSLEKSSINYLTTP